MLQIIHCPSHHHWMVAIIIRNIREANNILVYDFIFKKVDRETRKIICNIFQLLPISNVKIFKAQKQDCGLFSLAYATPLAFGQNPSNLRFCQELISLWHLSKAKWANAIPLVVSIPPLYMITYFIAVLHNYYSIFAFTLVLKLNSRSRLSSKKPPITLHS